MISWVRAMRGSVPAWLGSLIAGAVVAAIVASVLAWSHISLWPGTATTDAARHTWAFPLSGRVAPEVALLDQFGRPQRLSAYRGRPVVLAFVDSRCTSVCPLTAEILRDARARLGPRDASQVALIAINANPLATSVRAVHSWSAQHGMLHRWHFLTGSPAELRSVYRAYRIHDTVAGGQVEHDAAVIMLDRQGRERLYFNTADVKARQTVLSEEAAYTRGMRQILAQTYA